MKKLAILGGTPIRTKKFEYKAPIGVEEKNAVMQLMDSKVLSGFFQNFEGGEKVQEFEKLWEYGVRTLRISDEMFFLNRKYYVPILKGLIKRNIKFN